MAEESKTSIGKLRLRTSGVRAYTMLLALIVIWLYFQWATITDQNPYGLFLGPVNFSKLLQQMAVTGVLAVGMLMVIVCGNIDLSVGAVVGFAGGIAALSQGWGAAAALTAAVLIGLAIGAIQGALVAYVNIPAFIVTLGGLQAWRGLILKLTAGETVPVELPFFRALGRDLIDPRVGIVLAIAGVAAVVWINIRRGRSRQRHGLPAISPGTLAVRIALPSIMIAAFIFLMNKAGGVPIPVLFLLAVAIGGAYLTANTRFGRYLYAIGGNRDAARLSGINVRRCTLAAICLMGGLAGVASILHTARVGSASADAGDLMELDAIAACVIGGASLMGGRGTVFGAVLGALILASLNNGMSLLNYQSWAQPVVKGVVLVAAVGFDMFGRRRA